ncbi:MAG: hypothetical protein RR547_01475 [Raoultibacter sp.]
MEKSSSQKALKILSIVMIVLAILSIVSGLFMIIGGGAVAGTTVYGGDDSMAVMAAAAMIGGVMILVGGIINLIIGIFGLRGANNPQKIGVFFVLAIIGVVVTALSFVGNIMSGSDFTTIISGLISFVLPVACVVLANNIKKEFNV